jgi:hypothetical protein
MTDQTGWTQPQQPPSTPWGQQQPPGEPPPWQGQAYGGAPWQQGQQPYAGQPPQPGGPQYPVPNAGGRRGGQGRPPKKRHRVRNTIFGIVGGIVGLIVLSAVIGAATGAGKKDTADHHPVAAAATHKPKPSPTVALSASQQAFVNAVEARYPNESWNVGPLANVGKYGCDALEDGASQSALRAELRKHEQPGQPAVIVALAIKYICPNAIPHTIATFTGNGSENTGQFTISGNGNWTLNWSYNCSSMGTSNFIVYEDGNNDPTGNGLTVNELGSIQSGSSDAYGDAGTHYFEVIAGGCSWTLTVES